MKQQYEKYKKEDHEVWKLLFEKQMTNLKGKVCNTYMKCLDEMKEVLNEKSIPNYDLLNELLLKKTGWSIEVVEGLIPVRDFYQLLSERKFCAPSWIRSRQQLDYLEEPDMFHDIIGHIPLLMDANYADYIFRVGEIGVELSGNIEAEKELERIYWYTSEFGVLKEKNKLKVYGAGIISSFGETKNVFDTKVKVTPLNLEEILDYNFRTDIMQEKYFSVDSLDDLQILLDEFEERSGVMNKLSLQNE